MKPPSTSSVNVFRTPPPAATLQPAAGRRRRLKAGCRRPAGHPHCPLHPIPTSPLLPSPLGSHQGTAIPGTPAAGRQLGSDQQLLRRGGGRGASSCLLLLLGPAAIPEASTVEQPAACPGRWCSSSTPSWWQYRPVQEEEEEAITPRRQEHSQQHSSHLATAGRCGHHSQHQRRRCWAAPGQPLITTPAL